MPDRDRHSLHGPWRHGAVEPHLRRRRPRSRRHSTLRRGEPRSRLGCGGPRRWFLGGRPECLGRSWKSVGEGKSVAVRVVNGGSRNNKKKKTQEKPYKQTKKT